MAKSRKRRTRSNVDWRTLCFWIAVIIFCVLCCTFIGRSSAAFQQTLAPDKEPTLMASPALKVSQKHLRSPTRHLLNRTASTTISVAKRVEPLVAAAPAALPIGAQCTPTYSVETSVTALSASPKRVLGTMRAALLPTPTASRYVPPRPSQNGTAVAIKATSTPEVISTTPPSGASEIGTGTPIAGRATALGR